jgi:putative thiamine transport system permease protein
MPPLLARQERNVLQLMSLLAATPMVLLFLLPLVLSLALLLPGLTDVQTFRALFAHPQFTGGLVLTLFSGIAATVLSLVLAIVIIATRRDELLKRASTFLAVPHLALAMGVSFLIAPTGLLSRLIANIFTDWTSPPDWQTTQDPYAFGLIAALVLKETPFLVWAFASVMQQDELRGRFAREMSVARSLGHGPRAAFLRVLLPQLLRRAVWPIIAVFSYGMTVVEMALVIGPTQPPTFAQLTWTDLNDGEVATNARGAAATLVLSGLVATCMVTCWIVLRAGRRILSRWMTSPARNERSSPFSSGWIWTLITALYVAVVFSLVLQSFSVRWPFPSLMADVFSAQAWQRLFADVEPVLTTLVLALATSLMALLCNVLWFESQSPRRDRYLVAASVLMLCLPVLLVALGQYRLLLRLGATGHWFGLFLVHLAPVTAYVFVMLQGIYRNFDPRWMQVAHGLGKSRITSVVQIKLKMLRGPILSALAVGFAVSVAQYVPAQLAAAGRYTTLPMEAVTLTTSGNRPLIAASALVLMLLPLVAFQLSAWCGKPRWEQA